MYGYTHDSNWWIDPLGMRGECSVKQANKLLDEGATSVIVRSRSDAELLFLKRYLGHRNTTGLSAPEVKSLYGTKSGTYHWDDQIGSDGRVIGHSLSNLDGNMPHLQIHEAGTGNVICIFFNV